MLILKSASPRRKDFLALLGLEFDVSPSNVNEDWISGEPFLQYLERVTLAKLDNPVSPHTFISADTIVVFKDSIFPKPSSTEEAYSFLKDLAGKVHQVYSGIGLFKEGKTYFEYEKTDVTMKNWKEAEIRHYIQSQKPLDKAGAYGIQDENTPVETFSGSFSNVVGFPLRKFFLHYEKWAEFMKPEIRLGYLK